jgi:hypothetical protein
MKMTLTHHRFAAWLSRTLTMDRWSSDIPGINWIVQGSVMDALRIQIKGRKMLPNLMRTAVVLPSSHIGLIICMWQGTTGLKFRLIMPRT